MQRSLMVVAVALALSLAAAPASAGPSVEVKMARDVQDRQPVDGGTRFSPGKLYCWNLLQGTGGDLVVHHVWQRDGKQVWKRAVRARGSKWITWSYYNVQPGSWKVDVVDGEGNTLGSAEFVVK